LLRITRQVDSASGAYRLIYSDESALHSELHPDDPLPVQDDEWDTVLLEDVLGDIPDPHLLVREAARTAKSRLLVIQASGKGRGFSRLRQIAARHFPLFAGEKLRLAEGGEAALLVIPLGDSPEELAEFSRRSDLRPLRISLKIGVPADPSAYWGDIHYAEGFQRALVQAGCECTIQHLPQWEEGDEQFDVVIHLKGLSRYRTKPCHINIMWMINHPELHRDEELNGYDGLMVASRGYAEELSHRLERPVVYAPQAVDAERFCGAAETARDQESRFDIIFIGNSRQHRGGELRPAIANLLEARRASGRRWRIGIWGKFWEGHVPRKWIQGQSASAEAAARLYRSAKIVLNDHHPDMKSQGFLNERTFVIGACGGFQISDHVKGMEDEPVVFYDTPADFRKQIEFYLANPEERKQKAEALREKVLQEHTFDRSVSAFQGLLANIREKSRQSRPVPAVSIIATTCNCKRLLPRALRSAVNQTLRDWEMILVNDGGEDVSDVVREIGDSRIRYVQTAQAGKGHALNVGLRLSGGSYVAYLDDTDCYSPQHLDTLVSALRAAPAAEIVYGDYDEAAAEDPSGRRTINLSEQPPLLRSGMPMLACMHHRSMLEEAGVYDETLRVFAEWDMFQRLALAGHPRYVPSTSAARSMKGWRKPAQITAFDAETQAKVLSAFLNQMAARCGLLQGGSPSGTLETKAWLEAQGVLQDEIKRLREVLEEQWNALQRVRSSLPYRLYYRFRHLLARFTFRKSNRIE
jgi:hypothetical protein